MDDPAASTRGAGDMSLIEHLRELRTRMFRAVMALAVGTIIGYAVFPYLLDGLIAPYCSVLAARGDETCTLIALRPLEPFSVRIRTSLVIGLFIGGPVIFYQLWKFITPGLTQRERRATLPFVALSQLMFGLGIAFAYLVIPQALGVLLSLGGPRIAPMLSATEYLSFFLAMCVALGLVFELPLVLISLALVGVIDAHGLSKARPYAVVGMVTAAAIITPTTDAVTLLLVAGPMWLFYEISTGVAWIIGRRRSRRSS